MTVYGGDTIGGPTGFTYSGIFTRGTREDVLGALATMRFSGWVGPQEGDWVVAVPTRTHGAVAGEKMRAPDVARALAAMAGSASFAVTVEHDKLLRLWAYDDATEIGEYLSDPTVAYPYDDEVGPDPDGAEHAPAIAASCGAPDAGEDLEELLAEQLSESVNESERLTAVLRLLSVPDWVVASDSLPKDVPGGPRAKQFTKLGAGKEGVVGSVDAAVRGLVRKKK